MGAGPDPLVERCRMDQPAQRLGDQFPPGWAWARSVCQEYGLELVLLEPEEIAGALTDEVAICMLTHVNYRTGAMHDMAAVTAAAQGKGILCVWDLCHSAGAVPVDLKGAMPTSPSAAATVPQRRPGRVGLVWANPRLINRFWQPLSGWFGHAEPFKFVPDYHPAQGIQRYLCGTQPMVSLSVLQCGLDVFTAVEPLGGMEALRNKSLELTDLFIALVEERCQGHGLGLATPRSTAGAAPRSA
ncbi:Kynureninase [Manis javanica]|nr:Kynureninase [Manis javanica]